MMQTMGMRMRLRAVPVEIVRVLMMLVMPMPMRMFERVVRVLMQVALTQMQQARDGIDVSARQDHALYGGRTQASARMQETIRFDLLAQIGRSVDQEPALAIAAHRQGSLGPGHGACLAGTGAAAGICVGIPLGEAATGGGSQDDGPHDDRP